jgi:hypothetical protein
MEGGAARSATEALAATPFPSNAAGPGRLPAAVLPSTHPTPAPASVETPASQLALASPPLSRLSSSPAPSSRGPIVLVVVLSVVFAIAFVAASWLAISRMRHG